MSDEPAISETPAVSILIVAWNSGGDLERCLAALDAQSYRSFEVILWDNASDDGAVDRVAPRHWLRVHKSPDNLGFAAGNNRAAVMARGRYLVTLNPDAFAEPDWLQALVAAAERHPEAGSVGSTQLLAADPTRLDGAGDPYTPWGAAWRGGKGRPARPRVEGAVFGVCAAAALYRQEAFAAVGGFEERFFCFYEDVDLAARLRLAGWTAIQTPAARVHHVGSGSAPSGFVLRHATRNRIWTAIRVLPGFWMGPGLVAALTLAVAAALVGSLRGQGAVRFAAIGEALRAWRATRAERRAIQRDRKVSTGRFLAALTWNPLAHLRRAADVRPAGDLAQRIAEPPGEAPRVAAVMVTYNPDATLNEAVRATLPQVARLILIDNGSGAETVDRLRELATDDRVTLILNDGNAGLAAAQNQGIAEALRDSADWVLLLDDDSVPDPEMVRCQLACWQGLAERRRVGLLAPRLTDPEDTLKPYLLTAKGRFDLERTPMRPGAVARNGVFAIASGSLIRAEMLRVTGAMAADFFIDYVDIEFSLRLRRAGFEIVGVGDAVLRHRLGEFRETFIMGRRVALNTHDAWRRYFIHRNRVRVWRAEGGWVLGWLVWDMTAALYDLYKAVALEPDRGAKVRAILRGFWAGLSG